MVDVKRVLVFRNQNPLGLPMPQKIGGPLVTSLGVGVARFIAVQDQADNVARMPLVKISLLVRTDHVIRWGSDIGQIPNLAQVVTPAAKRMHVSHRCSSSVLGESTLGDRTRTATF